MDRRISRLIKRADTPLKRLALIVLGDGLARLVYSPFTWMVQKQKLLIYVQREAVWVYQRTPSEIQAMIDGNPSKYNIEKSREPYADVVRIVDRECLAAKRKQDAAALMFGTSTPEKCVVSTYDTRIITGHKTRVRDRFRYFSDDYSFFLWTMTILSAIGFLFSFGYDRTVGRLYRWVIYGRNE